MKTNEKSNANPTSKEVKSGSTNGNNPKKPGNDPDQTPDKEVERQPNANSKKQTPETDAKQKPGFKYPNANK